MVYRECDTVADVFHEVFELVKWDRSHIKIGEESDKVAYYFRAENKNHAPMGSQCPPSVPAIPSLFRDDKYLENEHVIFNETIRCYPQEFPAGETTFERLTRMAHFGLPTGHGEEATCRGRFDWRVCHAERRLDYKERERLQNSLSKSDLLQPDFGILNQFQNNRKLQMKGKDNRQ